MAFVHPPPAHLWFAIVSVIKEQISEKNGDQRQVSFTNAVEFGVIFPGNHRPDRGATGALVRDRSGSVADQ